MKMGAPSDDGRLAEINIIPLVDIMLVLLIIFMVAAPMLKEGIDVNLPEVSAEGVQASQDDFVMTIDKDGRIALGSDSKDTFSLVSLNEKLEAFFEGKKKKELYLQADKGIRYGFVAEVMAACQQAGVERIGMITMPPQKKSR